MTGGPIRVVIVDDHPMYRLGLAATISEMPGIDVVGEAARGDELEAVLDRVDTDVVVLDIGLPDISGLALLRWIATHHPSVRVVMLTMSDDIETALSAIREGARGYMVKGTDGERIALAIRTVVHGDIVFDESLLPGLAAIAPARRRSVDRPFPELTDREFEVFELIAQGSNNTDIARTLFLTTKTVRNHVTNIFSKLHVPDRAGAIVLAHRHDVGT